MVSSRMTVSDLVVERPSRSRVFEELGIDYCCGGGAPLAEACAGAKLEVGEVIRELERREAGRGGEDCGLSRMGMGELVDHIVETHHAYLKEELPRLSFLVDKVANVHGESHPELVELRPVFEIAAGGAGGAYGEGGADSLPGLQGVGWGGGHAFPSVRYR